MKVWTTRAIYFDYWYDVYFLKMATFCGADSAAGRNPDYYCQLKRFPLLKMDGPFGPVFLASWIQRSGWFVNYYAQLDCSNL